MNKKTTTVSLDKSKAREPLSPDFEEPPSASQRKTPLALENTIDINDIVDKMSLGSFPASDPPSSW